MKTLIGSAVIVAALAGSAMGQTFPFPSAGSAVVGSVGFINPNEVGFFWTATRGDSVSETFGSALASVNSTTLRLNVVQNALNSGNSVNWDVLLNGTTIGNFTVPQGFLGALNVPLAHAPVAAVGGNYALRIQVTNVVPGGGGSHSLAANIGTSVTFVPAPASLGLLGLAGLAAARRRR
jgi:MYXO-CTERM domain-containing protein